MRDHKLNPNKDPNRLVLQFLAERAQRTGKPLEELLAERVRAGGEVPEEIRRELTNPTGRSLQELVAKYVRGGGEVSGRACVSVDADWVSRAMQQSREEHLSPDRSTGPRLKDVGRPNPPASRTPLEMTVARTAVSVRDVPEAPRRLSPEERAERLARALARAQAPKLGDEAAAHPERAAPRLYALLVRLAVDVARERYGPHARKLSQVVFAVPLELIATHLGVDRTTVWRALKRIEATGLAKTRDWYTTSTAGGGEGARVAAKLFAVRLRPGRARLYHEDFRHRWRDLDADRAQRRTAWAWKQHHERPGYAVLRAWALGRPVAPDESPPNAQLYDILSLPDMLPHLAAPVITALADYLAARLRDPHSRGFYAKLLWRVVHLELRAEVLIAQIERVEADRREGWAKNPGALLAARLTQPAA